MNNTNYTVKVVTRTTQHMCSRCAYTEMGLQSLMLGTSGCLYKGISVIWCTRPKIC